MSFQNAQIATGDEQGGGRKGYEKKGTPESPPVTSGRGRQDYEKKGTRTRMTTLSANVENAWHR